MDTAWTEWSASNKTIQFTMNGLAASAEVTKPRLGLEPSVLITVKDDSAPNQYYYMHPNGSGVTSGVGYSIGAENAGTLPTVYFPQVGNPGLVNPDDATFYTSSNAVRATKTFTTSTGQQLEYDETLYFSPAGVIQTNTFKNAGSEDIADFGLLNKVNVTMQIPNTTPARSIHYGAKKFQYYVHDISTSERRDLYIEATPGSGITSSRAADYSYYTDNSISGFSGLDGTWDHTEGELYGDGNTDLLFANAPQTLAAGQSRSTQYRVFFKAHGAVNLEYLDKATNSPLKVPESFETSIEGTEGDSYSSTQPDIEGYTAAGIADDSAPESGTLTAGSPSPSIKYLYTANPATITYDGNGSDSGSTDDTVGVTDEKVSVADNGFTRDGYTFTGWNTAANGSGTVYASGDAFVLKPTKTKLFAQWKADEAKVTYDGNGSDSDSGTTDDTVGVTDESVAVADNGFTRDGYTFTGWNTAADGSGTAYSAGDEVTLTPSELKLFAQWKADEAKVTYDGNSSDSGSTDDTVGVTDEKVAVADNGFARDGYTFTGWNTAADGSGTAYAAGDEVTLSVPELKLYAQWKVEETPVTPEDPAAKVTPVTPTDSDVTPDVPVPDTNVPVPDTKPSSKVASDSKMTPSAPTSKVIPSTPSAGIEKETSSLLARTGAGVGIFAVVTLLAAFIGIVVVVASRRRHATSADIYRKH